MSGVSRSLRKQNPEHSNDNGRNRKWNVGSDRHEYVFVVYNYYFYIFFVLKFKLSKRIKNFEILKENKSDDSKKKYSTRRGD